MLVAADGASAADGVLAGGFWPLVLVIAGSALVALLSLVPISRARKQLREGRVAFMDGFVEREIRESSDSATGGTNTFYRYVVYQQQSGLHHSAVPSTRRPTARSSRGCATASTTCRV
jgi:hypothetical protein